MNILMTFNSIELESILLSHIFGAEIKNGGQFEIGLRLCCEWIYNRAFFPSLVMVPKLGALDNATILLY